MTNHGRLIRIDVVSRDGTPLAHNFIDKPQYRRFNDDDISCIVETSVRSQGFPIVEKTVHSSTPERLHLELVVETVAAATE